MKIFNMDNKGVSPVVGTILLIAITVVLAGTIGYFATQQGPGDAAPSVSLSHEGANLHHNGGGTLQASEVVIQSSQYNGTISDDGYGSNTFGAGDSHNVGTGDITVIHNATDSVLLRD